MEPGQSCPAMARPIGLSGLAGLAGCLVSIYLALCLCILVLVFLCALCALCACLLLVFLSSSRLVSCLLLKNKCLLSVAISYFLSCFEK